jgi:hypothetical protein
VSGEGVAAMANLPLVVAPRRDPDHAAHAWCGRVCVAKFLHKQLKQALGGPVTRRAQRMRAFYAETLDAWPSARPIGDEPVKFWRKAFAARFGHAAAASTRHEGVRRGTGDCPHTPRCEAAAGVTAFYVCRDRILAEARADRERKSG